MAFSRILVPLDGSQFAESALAHAGRIGRAFSSRVTLLQVLDDGSEDSVSGASSVDWRLRKAEASRYLKAIAEDPRLQGLEVDRVLNEGRAAEMIADHIERHAINLLVMSCWGAGGGVGFAFGGTAHKLLASITISCLIVRDPQHSDTPGGQPYRRILVPLDGTQDSEVGAFMASALAGDQAVDITLLHVLGQPLMPRRRPLTSQEQALRDQVVDCNRRVAAGYLEDLCDRMGNRQATRIRLEITDHPARRIVEVCREERPELMVLTAHESNWSNDMNLPFLLRQADAPVLMLQDHGAIRLPGIALNRTG